jgi:uncharacterized iron-regulated membrane protein
MSRPQLASSYRFFVYWHFWIGILVSPILMAVAGSGFIMLFRTELETDWYSETVVDRRAADALRLAPGNSDPKADLFSERIHSGYFQRLIAIAQRDLPPNIRIARIELAQRQGWLPAVLVAPIERPWPQRRIYVDVDANRTTGSLPEKNVFTTAITLHRTLFAGWIGRMAVEFTASWLIVSMLMGMRLGWQTARPARALSSAAALQPQAAQSIPESNAVASSRAQPWKRFRNAHAWSGMLIGPIVIMIAWNGLQFAELYGTLYHGLARATGQYDYLLDRPKSSPTTPSSSLSPEPSAMALAGDLDLDSVLQSAQTHGMAWQRIAIQMPNLPEDGYMIESGGDLPPSMTQTLYLDRHTGGLLQRFEMGDLGPLAQWNKWSYPVHVGSVGGIWTQCLWGAVVLVLASMPATASGMMLARYRRGQRLRPERGAVGSWRTLAFLVSIALLLPTVGLSMLAVGAAWWLTEPMRRPQPSRRNPSP